MTKSLLKLHYRWTEKAVLDLKEYKKTGDAKSLKTLFELLQDVELNGNLKGMGHPEKLRKDFKGFYSRQINEVDRLVYRIIGDSIEIAQCKGHYND